MTDTSPSNKTHDKIIKDLEKIWPKTLGFMITKTQDIDLAKDLVQDAYIKAVRSIKNNGYNEEGNLNAWFNRIAFNLFRDHLRKVKKLPTSSLSQSEEFARHVEEKNATTPDFDTFITGSVNLEQTLAYVEHILPPEQFDVLKMRIVKDIPFKEIAEREDININTALGRMRYALINLRKHPEVIDYLTGDDIPPEITTYNQNPENGLHM